MCGNFKEIYNQVLEFTEEKEQLMFWCTIIGFVFLTILGIYFHETWLDEAQAWLIAQNLSFPELIDYLKYEGHLFVWYTILMPFAKLGAPYPITMQIINWLFALGTVLVLWKKAPFNSVVKVLITFSVPICYQYAVIARCYSVGIFLLFLLLVYYKDKLKHPYLYPILVFLCANTSVMCLFPASALGILFFIDYIRSNRYFYKQKEFYFIYFVVIFSIWFIGLQLLGGEEMTMFLNPGRNATFNTVINTYSQNLFLFIFKSFSVIGWLLFPMLAFQKNLKVLFFYIYTTVGLYFILYNCYQGSHWHYYFFYIYLIGSLWLYNFEEKQNKLYSICFKSFFVLMTIGYVVLSEQFYTMDITHTYEGGEKLVQKIVDYNIIRNENVYLFDAYGRALIPYFNQNNIKVYDSVKAEGAKFYNYKEFKKYYTYNKSLMLYNLKNKSSYLIVAFRISEDTLFDKKYWDVKLISEVDSKPKWTSNFYLYKITDKRKYKNVTK